MTTGDRELDATRVLCVDYTGQEIQLHTLYCDPARWVHKSPGMKKTLPPIRISRDGGAVVLSIPRFTGESIGLAYRIAGRFVPAYAAESGVGTLLSASVPMHFRHVVLSTTLLITTGAVSASVQEHVVKVLAWAADREARDGRKRTHRVEVIG